MDIRKTLCISDLDGTLLNGRSELSAYTVQSLNAMIARGLSVSVATARTVVSALQILNNVNWNMPLVLMNGVLIYDPVAGQVRQVLPLSGEAALAVINVLKQRGVTGIMYQMEGAEQQAVYESAARGPLLDYIAGRVARYREVHLKVDSFSIVKSIQVLYFTLIDERGAIERLSDALAPLHGINYFTYEDHNHPGLWGLEIHSDRASKRDGIAYLREYFGFERVIGFGDGGNDLPMFEACDLRVAVRNAKPEVLARADHICASNEDDGVVRWIMEHVL